MWLGFWQVSSIVATALCLVPAGAHLAEMPHKLALEPAEYMVVQQIYAGWALFGIVIAVALVATLVHTRLVRADATARWLSLLAFLSLVATQVLFWTFVYPVNAATANWTRLPQPFAEGRLQWESAHAANAVLTFAALVLIVSSVVRQIHAGPPSRSRRARTVVVTAKRPDSRSGRMCRMARIRLAAGRIRARR